MNESSLNLSITAVTPPDYGDHSVWTIVSWSIVYGLLSLTAFVGNSVVVWIICKRIYLIFFLFDHFRDCPVTPFLEEMAKGYFA